jgi:hypothetical protein
LHQEQYQVRAKARFGRPGSGRNFSMSSGFGPYIHLFGL